MTARPVIFSSPMVCALLYGRKTQTRRLVKPQPVLNVSGLWVWPPDWVKGAKRGIVCVQTDDDGLKQSLEYDPSRTLRYASGDRLWVREAFTIHHYLDTKASADEVMEHLGAPPGMIAYRAGHDPRDEEDGPWPWRPSIHMPRWASRLTLLVTDVRVQRVQEISEADVIAEGLRADDPAPVGVMGRPIMTPTTWSGGQEFTAVAAFRRIWISIHGPDAWDRNDWVAAVTFTVEQRNIDA